MLEWILFIFLYIGNASSQDPPVILTDCPKGANAGSVVGDYIRSGTVASCTCSKRVTSQTGSVVWSSEDGTELVEGDSVAELEFTADEILSGTFKCFIKDTNGAQVGDEVTYKPDVAYGPRPGSVSLMVNVSDSIAPAFYDLCPDDPTNITVDCRIPIRDVNPVPRFYIHLIEVGKKETVTLVTVTLSDDRKSFVKVIDLRPEKAGKYEIKCVAFNPVFQDFTEEASQAITAREPPNTLPVLTINARNGQSFSGHETAIVIENNDLQVTCKVNGGSPEVQRVNLECGAKTSNTQGTSASLQFDATRNAVERACICSADHVTGCYSLSSEIMLDIVYQPKILEFTANSQTTELRDIERGDHVDFLCKVEGSPVPSLKIVSDRSGFITQPAKELTRSETLQNIQCDGTDRYYCVADNGIESNAALTQKSVDVYVKCSPTLRNPELQDKVYEVKLGQNLTIKFAIVGYPAPNDFILTVDRGTHENVVNKTRYKVTYISDTDPTKPSPLGEITLALYKLGKADMVSYNFRVINGEGSGLVYNFKIEEKPEDNPGLYIGIGVGVGVALLLIVIVVIVICYRKRRRSKAEKATRSIPETDISSNANVPKPPDSAPPHRQEGRTLNDYDRLGSRSKNSDYPYQIPKGGRRASDAKSDYTVKSSRSQDDYIVPSEQPIYDYVDLDELSVSGARSVKSDYYIPPVNAPPVNQRRNPR